MFRLGFSNLYVFVFVFVFVFLECFFGLSGVSFYYIFTVLLAIDVIVCIASEIP